MRDFLIQTWTWLLDEKNQKALTVLVTILGGAIVAVIGGAWALYKHLSAKPSVNPPISTEQNTTFGNNSPIQKGGEIGNIVGTGHAVQITNNFGISLEDHEKALKKRTEEIKEELKTAHAKEKETLEKELAAAWNQVANKKKTYAKLLETLNQTNEKLTSLKGQFAEGVIEKAKVALNKGDTAEAEKLFEETLSRGIKQAALAAMAAFQLGSIAKQKIEYEKAYSYYKKAVEMESGNPEYLNEAGIMANTLGRYAEAEVLFKRSFEIREKFQGPDHVDVARSLNNLANIYKTQGRCAEAEPIYKRALEIKEKSLGLDHPDVAGSLNNLANLYDEQGEYAKAEPLYKRSLEIREKSLGLNHLDVASSLSNLAILNVHQGKYSEAEPLHKRSLEIREKFLRQDHLDVAASLNNLGEVFRHQRRYAEAKQFYERSLEIKEKSLGLDHPDIATTLNNLAVLNVGQGKFADAEPLYKRALEIREQSLGPGHPDVATSLNNLAALYINQDNQGRYAEVEPLLKRAMAIMEKAFGATHPYLVGMYGNYAMLLRKLDREAEAVECERKAKQVKENLEKVNKGTK